MRVTQGMLSDQVIADLQQAENLAMQTQSTLASGNRIQRPSDDPGGTAVALGIQSDLALTQQYQSNVSDGKSWLQTTDGALADAGTTLQQVRALVVEGANGALTQAQRNAIAQQVQQLEGVLLDTANTRLGDQYVFSGDTTATAAFASVGGAIAYQGRSGSILREISPGSYVTVNVSGNSAFGNATDPAFVFTTLSGVVTDFEAGNVSNLSGADLQNLDAGLNTLLGQRAVVGATLNRLSLADNRLTSVQSQMKQLLASTTNADIALTIVDFQQQQQAFQLALGASARLLQPSLLDFLR